ncbi:hypothetical protein [Streptomyces sp. MK7]|uniref:hypothetical protein n=1 Tax=Streptomyces sp. MK7 TaxID=3067635 RepID=UPI00292FED6A|nr:hypothetical protein [Streptomyces sp. MK7]
MPHLLAPELAAAVEDGMRPVAPSQPAEVYTLAASLWWAITGDWPLDYEGAGADPAQLTASELRRAIGKGAFQVRSPSMWPGVQRVLSTTVLAQPPELRPTAVELAAAVRAAVLR